MLVRWDKRMRCKELIVNFTAWTACEETGSQHYCYEAEEDMKGMRHVSFIGRGWMGFNGYWKIRPLQAFDGESRRMRKDGGRG